MSAGELIPLVLEDAFWSAIAACGFAILFSVPQRALWGCAVAGAAGHAVRTLLIEIGGIAIEPATLLGATAVGFIAIAFARWYRVPAPVFSVSGVIPMVPGVFAYSAMLGIIRATSADSTVVTQLLSEAAVDAIKAGLILAALATGIALPALLFYREHPVA
jgi:uncharacterized membrane protein YjjB (DUF3815 family)